MSHSELEILKLTVLLCGLHALPRVDRWGKEICMKHRSEGLRYGLVAGHDLHAQLLIVGDIPGLEVSLPLQLLLLLLQLVLELFLMVCPTLVDFEAETYGLGDLHISWLHHGCLLVQFLEIWHRLSDEAGQGSTMTTHTPHR